MILGVATAFVGALVGLGGQSAAASCTPVEVQTAPSVLRPTSAGRYRYESGDIRTFAGDSAVVHYVVSGRDAPPATDADADGVPDYVELVAGTADAALRFYAAPFFGDQRLRGFDPPPCDREGPDARPDIYIKNTGVHGLAIGPADGEGGAFVFVDPGLEGDARTVTGGVAFTVAHEVFHLVQFAYEPRGMPAWVAEGTANLFTFLWQRLDEPVLLASLDKWFAMTDRSIVEPGISQCDRCYGGILWWATTVVNGRPILVRYFELLRERSRRGLPRTAGLDELIEAAAAYYRSAGLSGFAADALFYEFEAFAEGIYFVLAPKRPPILYAIRPTMRPRTTSRRLEALATHYVRLRLPAGTRAVRIRVTGGVTRPRFSLFLGVDGTRCRRAVGPRFRPRTTQLEQVVVVPTGGQRDRRNSVLMITGGTVAGGKYRLEYRAYTSPQRGVGAPRSSCGIPEAARGAG